MSAKMNIRSIIITISIICLISMFFINISFAANTGKIIVETARLREKPDTDSKVLELTSEGEQVEILEEDGEWYKVKYNKITGYIRKDLIELENKAQSEVKNENITENETQNEAKNENIIENTTQNEAENKVEENTNTENTEPKVEEPITPPVEEKKIELGNYKISTKTKLKIIPLISAIEIHELAENIEVQVIEILNNWAKVKTTEGKEGWLRTDKLAEIQKEKQPTEPEQPTETKPQEKVETKTMYVNTELINVRKSASTSSEIVKKLSLNTQVTVFSNENGWYSVEIDGTKGYIAESLLSTTKKETSRSATTTRNNQNTVENTTKTPETPKAEVVNSETSKNEQTNTATTSTGVSGNQIVEYAKQFLGCKYVYGGTTTKGFDCSGFTQFVYKHFGITLNRTAAAQYSNGKSVKDLQAGDLVMFGKSGINHVGIYMGGNTFIHAANPSRGVTTDTLASGYYKTNYVGARRIL